MLEADGVPIKSYAVEVKDGKLARIKLSRLDYEPHTGFISPRFIDTSLGSSNYKMIDAYWVPWRGKATP